MLDLYGTQAAATARSPPTACSPAGWSSAACGSSSSTTATGTTTATWSSDMTRQLPARSTRPRAALVTDLKQRGHARRHAGHLGRRVRPHADGRRAATTAATTTSTASRCGWPAAASRPGMTLRRDRRARLQRRRGPRPRPRPARHDPAPARHRPHAADLPLPGPRLPPDRRERQGGEADPGLNRRRHPEKLMMAPRRL